MSAPADPFSPYRARLLTELRRLVDGLEFSHAAVLRQHLFEPVSRKAPGEPDNRFVAASLCLLTTEALGRDATLALPAAAALALLESMAEVLTQLSTGEDDVASRPLVESWGMARVLNAGDAFFALAQASFVGQSTQERPEYLVDALGWLGTACRALSDELFTASLTPERATQCWTSLLVPAVALGALSAEASAETATALATALCGADEAPAGELAALSLTDGARDRLVSAITRVRRLES